MIVFFSGQNADSVRVRVKVRVRVRVRVRKRVRVRVRVRVRKWVRVRVLALSRSDNTAVLRLTGTIANSSPTKKFGWGLGGQRFQVGEGGYSSRAPT